MPPLTGEGAPTIPTPYHANRFVFENVCESRLVRHWSAVEAVAAALLEREELTGDEVTKLIEEAATG